MNLGRYTDSEYLKNQQYANAGNLGARIALHERFGTHTYPLYSWQVDLMMADFGPRARLLELGCGRADLWARNTDRIPSGWNITLTDFSAGMLNDAHKRLGAVANQFQLAEANAEAIPYPDQQFDGVIANFMLYHVPDRNRAIGEMRRVLKPHGSLHAVTLGDYHMFEFREMAREIMPGLFEGQGQISRPFSLDNGAEQLLEHFETVQRIDYSNPLVVDEVEPLVDYFGSVSSTVFEDDSELRTAFRELATARMKEHGALTIRRETGLFIARGYQQA